jgi:hypothetical protein
MTCKKCDCWQNRLNELTKYFCSGIVTGVIGLAAVLYHFNII